jgi:hypothetical protein
MEVENRNICAHICVDFGNRSTKKQSVKIANFRLAPPEAKAIRLPKTMSTKGTEKTIKDHPFAFSGHDILCPYKVIDSGLVEYRTNLKAVRLPKN